MPEWLANAHSDFSSAKASKFRGNAVQRKERQLETSLTKSGKTRVYLVFAPWSCCL